MSGQTSFYFTLFKMFQLLDRVQDGPVHGAPGGGGTGFDLTAPNASLVVFSATPGVLAPGDITPADSPLWAVVAAHPGLVFLAGGPAASRLAARLWS